MSDVLNPKLTDGLSTLVAVILAAAAISTSSFKMAGIAGLVAGSFALVAWLLRSVDGLGAVTGGTIAFVFYDKGGWRIFAVLLFAFVVTLAATKFAGWKRTLSQRIAGRTAAQVLANLLVPTCLLFLSSRVAVLIACASLAELAADTVSSELGETFGGTAYLTTNLQRVRSGTNGGISLIGTVCGFAAATLVATAGFFLDVKGALWIPEVAGFAGMFVDSILGATLENRRWLNNEAVNFLGTGSAAGIAWLLIRLNG